MALSPRGREIYRAAVNVHHWLEVLDALEDRGVMAARLKAQDITGTMTDDTTLAGICERTGPDDEFIITGTIPRWRFWNRTDVPRIDNCETRAGILMAKKYRRRVENGNSKDVGKDRYLKTFPNGIMLDYITHEIVSIDLDAPPCSPDMAPYEWEHMQAVDTQASPP